jgi:NADH dehydrogenase
MRMTIESGRRITVFGASGFIGRYVVKRLAASGAIVRAAMRDPVAGAFLKPMGTVGQVVPMRADITDREAVVEAVHGADSVINLVGILYERGRRSFQAIHADGADHLAAAARAAGVSEFVQVSAIGADAQSPSAYARSKAAGEAAVQRSFPAAVIIRPSIVFGAEDEFFNRFATMARLSPVLPLFGGGMTRFQPVYVGDVAEAIVRALGNPAAAGRTYEIGGPRVATFRELLELMLEETGRKTCFVSVPFGLAKLQAMVCELLPVPPLTRDQVTMLQRDNVCSADAPGLRQLGIEPTAMEAILPTYLDSHRRGGRYASGRFA